MLFGGMGDRAPVAAVRAETHRFHNYPQGCVGFAIRTTRAAHAQQCVAGTAIAGFCCAA
jgi:hypothetical protein